jgi:hypothetical protein
MMLKWKILGMIACLCVIKVVAGEPDLTAAIRNMEISGAGITNDDTHLRPPTEQEKLDTIKSALDKLPNSELTRLGVNIEGQFIAGTAEADLLFNAWNLRQKELKDALAGMLKPVERMQEISNILQNTSVEDPSIVHSLVLLESLLADVDNARDFHTIGGWAVISSIFQNTETPIRVKSAIALCVGTAVKNSYDYQLWVLEASNSTLAPVHSPLIFALVVTLEKEAEWLIANMYSPNAGEEELVARTGMVNNLLYGVFSATRGNPDVQESLQDTHRQQTGTASTLVSSLHALGELLLATEKTSPHAVLQSGNGSQVHKTNTAIARKIWGFASDMIDEWLFINGPHGLISGEHGGVEVQQAAMQLKPLGALFLQDSWWLTGATDAVWTLSASCLSPSTATATADDKEGEGGLQSVPSSSPVNLPHMKTEPIFNEECQVLTSPGHRAIYQSAIHVRKQMLVYSEAAQSLTEEERAIRDSVELSSMMLKSHSLLRDHDSSGLVGEVIEDENFHYEGSNY